MTVPNEAAEAIHAAICEESLADHLDPEWPGKCMKAAAAAAPFIAAQAWDEGRRVGIDECAGDLVGANNPYRSGT